MPIWPHLDPVCSSPGLSRAASLLSTSGQNPFHSMCARASSMGPCVLASKDFILFLIPAKKRESPRVNSRLETIAPNVCLGHILLQPRIQIKVSEILGSLGVRHEISQ